MSTGNDPFEGNDERDIQEKILNGNVDFNEELWTNVDQSLIDLIKSCLITDVENRASIDDLLNSDFFNKSMKSNKCYQINQNFLNKLYFDKFKKQVNS